MLQLVEMVAHWNLLEQLGFDLLLDGLRKFLTKSSIFVRKMSIIVAKYKIMVKMKQAA